MFELWKRSNKLWRTRCTREQTVPFPLRVNLAPMGRYIYFWTNLQSENPIFWPLPRGFRIIIIILRKIKTTTSVINYQCCVVAWKLLFNLAGQRRRRRHVLLINVVSGGIFESCLYIHIYIVVEVFRGRVVAKKQKWTSFSAAPSNKINKKNWVNKNSYRTRR